MIDIKRWRDFCWSKDHILILYGSNKTIEISNVFTDVGCYYYNCESGQISFNGFNAQTVSTISLSTLAIFDQPLDVIILVGIDFPKINFLARTMKDFSQEVNFYVGGKSEYFQYHGCKYLYSKAQLINSEVENSFADLSIPLYDYLSRIDLEQEKVRGKCIVDRYHNICLEDFIGVYTNHRYGKRVTCYQGGPYKSKLHMFGASTLYGVGVEDKDTITSLLQKKLNKHGKFIQVINHGICGYVMDGLLNRISRLGLAYGDIVVWGLSFSLIWNYENITLSAFLYILNEVKNRCASFGARFICLNQPSIYDLNVRTELENNYYQFVDVKQDKIASPKLKYKLISALKKNRIDYIDPINMFQQPRRYTEVFLDDVHYLPSGNQLIADSIYNDFHHNVIVQDRFGMTIGKGEGEEEYRFKNILIKKYESNLRDYLRSIKTRPISPQAVIGSVNLNANPFTNGHLHLVKYAAQQVDWLYVFVIEEDASYFSFQERYKLVCENLQNYDNILVNPSGYLMTSKVTFPEYFNKENMQNKDVNCDKDLLYFASQIALALGISKRFIGEEPYCNITKQHNERMKQILPLYNIDVVEVKRLKYENGYISASHVRQLYRENHMLELKKMVPDITYEFLKNRKNKKICTCIIKEYSVILSKKQEAVTIFNKTENRLPTIRPFLNGDEGKNYGFDDCMAYLMECLNEDARLDYWIFTGISGDGYTMVYNRNHSNYCEYCIAGYTSGQELVSRVFNAIGYDYTYVDDKEINLKKSEYIKKLISYIDKGIPVLARTTLAATPADVDVRTYLTYVGYEDDGKTLLFKSDYDNLFCYDTSSTIKQDWIFPGEKIREVPFEKIVSNAVADLPRLMTLPEKDGQFFGSQAFRAWADDIEKGRYGEKSDLWSDYGVYVCNLATNCMANNSTHAPSVVNLLAQFSPQYSEMRTKIANLYFHMGHGDGVGGAWRKLEDLEAGFNVKAETFQDKERCRKIVAVLRECADDMDEIVQTLQEAL